MTCVARSGGLRNDRPARSWRKQPRGRVPPAVRAAFRGVTGASSGEASGWLESQAMPPRGEAPSAVASTEDVAVPTSAVPRQTSDPIGGKGARR